MINHNKFANQKIQELGQNLFQGEEFAQQIANKQLDQPVPPPGPYGDINPIMNKESREARRQERKNIRMANKALRSSRRERAKGVKEQGQENYSYDGYEKGRYNKKGDDIEYGKTPRYSKKNPPSATLSGAIAGFSNSALNQDDPKVKKSEAQKLPSKKGKDVKLRPGVKPKEVYSEMVGSIGSPPRLKTPLNQGKKSKYRMVNVQDLEDMGRIKKDKISQYSNFGIHKDDLIFDIEEHPIKKFGSQGQQKSFLIALKLAQFDFIKTQSKVNPILLMDDVFDKLDEQRVEQIIALVKNQDFGQLFISDTHADRTEKVIKKIHQSYKMFKL